MDLIDRSGCSYSVSRFADADLPRSRIVANSNRVKNCLYELRRRQILVRDDVVMHHDRSRIPYTNTA